MSTRCIPMAGLLLATSACGARHAPSETPAVRAVLDSATASRLCTAPDSVLAGRAVCVLRDQAQPIRLLLPPPRSP